MDFERMLARHKDAVYRQMVRVCGNREDAEDTLVEAILAAYRSADSLRSEDAFGGWLAMIGRRVCIRLKRRDSLTPVIALADNDVAVLDVPEEQMSLKQMKGCVIAAIESLPELYRQVYVLREIEEMPAEDVAKQLGLSVPAVKSRLHRARKMVRDHLDESLCMAE